MRFVIGGASGFLGAPLVSHLRSHGHDVTRLVRGATDDADASPWNPVQHEVDEALIGDADVVVNLSGAPIQQWPRTKKRGAEILNSRRHATATLASAVAKAAKPPVFLSGSGMSWYGTDRGAEVLDESSGPGDGFLAGVAQAWEDAARPALEAGGRVAFLRTSIVLDDEGGALRLMKVPFSLGLGAKLGAGDQYFSVISRHDWIRAVAFLATSDVSGPVNLAAPQTPTNAEFTRALAAALGRPAVLTAPSFALRRALGGLSEDLLGSLQVKPDALTAAGFTFDDPTIEAILTRGLR